MMIPIEEEASIDDADELKRRIPHKTISLTCKKRHRNDATFLQTAGWRSPFSRASRALVALPFYHLCAGVPTCLTGARDCEFFLRDSTSVHEKVAQQGLFFTFSFRGGGVDPTSRE